ncbi:MAG TPA: NADH:flavin oxidoreductase [Candidatus Kapabacteria bacterium]|nr:NADH:flavin oxidoreductase [Candidatus Kapabacteria bacterium]
MYEKLLSPLTIGSMKLANRLVVPAMVTRLSGEDGMVNAAIMDRYVRFAKGETGLVVVEAMSVHGAKSGPLLKISSDEFKPGLTEIAKKVHSESSSKIIPQIIHFLKIARSGWRQRIEDLSVEDIKLIIKQYGEAAARARECGFDGVELHMAHAYTMSSFLSRKNKRPDEFGGKSLENRLRVPIQVLHEVRKSIGKDFPIGIRFLGEEAIKGGYTSEESSEIAVRFAEEGADYLSLSAGGKFEDAIHKEGEVLYPYTGYSGDRCMPPAEYPDAYNLHMGEAARRKLRKHGLTTPVISTGKISTPDLAEEILQNDRADLIGMARGLLADPDIIKKIREGAPEKIVKCIYWNVCKALDETFHEVVCGLWPKGMKQAPLSDDAIAPEWKSDEPLKFLARTNQIRLNWEAATDNEEVAGYEIWRSENSGKNFDHIYSVTVSMYTDNLAQSGRKYQYYVRAYDLAGNKSTPSNIVNVEVPMKIALMEEA